MANKQRFRTGHNQCASGKVKAGVKAEIGSLMYKSPLDNYWYPFSSIVAAGTGPGFAAGTALANASGAFAGVLMEGATAGTETKDSDCLVGYGAVYEMDASVALAADKPAGTPVTPFVDGATLSNTKVALAANMTSAIGVLARFEKQGKLTVYVMLYSAEMGTPLS